MYSKRGCNKIIQEFEQIIQNEKSDNVWLDYYQGQVFQKFREKEQFGFKFQRE